MKPWLARMLLYTLLLVALFGPLIAMGDDAPCRREGDRVSCEAGGFKLLTDACVQAKADAKTCALKLADAQKELAARDTALNACQVALSLVPEPEPPRSATRQLVGYVAGMASTTLILSALALPVPSSARFAMVSAGVVGLGGGVILVLP